MAILGERLRSLRRTRELTQGQIAVYAKVDRSYISQIENGHIASVGSAILGRIAQLLATTTDYLIGLTANPFPRENPGLDERESGLIALFRSFNEDERGMMLAYGEWLAHRFK